MDIARLLNDSPPSDHEPFKGVVFSPAEPSERAVARPRPQRQRQLSRESLQARHKALEYVFDNLPHVLRDLDIITSSTISDSERELANSEDDDAQRIRLFLKRTILLTNEAHMEIKIQAELLRMLKHHHESSTNLRKLFRGISLDDWFWQSERWRVLTLAYYKQLSAKRAYAIVQETVQHIENHKHPQETIESGTQGWRGWYRLDDDGHYVRFMTQKTMHATVEQLVGLSWSILSDGDVYRKYHLGVNCEFFHQIVQRISPDIMVVQMVQKYPTLVQLTHSLALVFRVKTETGFRVALRAIESPMLLDLMKAEGLSLSGSFWWETYEVKHRDEEGVCDAVEYTLAGSMGSDNPTYARRWRDEILFSMVRSESKRTGTSLLTIESSPEKDSAPDNAN